MSLILEALKKSEQQRQREKAPSLQSIHQPVAVVSEPSPRPWLILVAFIAVCNFAFFGYWFWQQKSPAAPAAAATLPAQVETGASAAVSQNASPAQSAAQEVPVSNAPPEFTQISPRTTATSSVQVQPSLRVEEIGELPESVRNNLPAMTFSFHVYSENPEQRTIIINDRRVREGDEISGSLRLESITQDGVILFFEQRRIHIGVLSDW